MNSIIQDKFQEANTVDTLHGERRQENRKWISTFCNEKAVSGDLRAVWLKCDNVTHIVSGYVKSETKGNRQFS